MEIDAENSYLLKGGYFKHLSSATALEFHLIRVLDYLLHDSNAAPIRHAIESSDICEAFESIIDDTDGYQLIQ